MHECPRCGKERPDEAYAKSKVTGLPVSSCRICRNDESRERRLADPERARAATRAWYYRDPAHAGVLAKEHRERRWGIVTKFPAEKTCAKCGETKPIDDFHRSSAVRDGHFNKCKPCTIEKARAWQRENPERVRQTARRRLCAQYGITESDYLDMLERQHGVCGLCGRPPLDGKLLYIDHSHATGQVRGLLHSGCNLILGQLEANPKTMRHAIGYLKAARQQSEAEQHTLF